MSIFATVARHRSFRAAARELGISVSAVSHAVSGLEAGLGVRLLARSTRSVAVTEAGQRLLEGLAPALTAIEEAVETATASHGRIAGRIRLSVPRTAAELVLVPLCSAFRSRCPDVIAELVVQDGFADIVAEGFDAGMRFGESLEQDMVAVPVGPAMRSAVVGAPSYFADHPPPATPRELHGHACIRRRFAGGGLYRWDLERNGEAFDIAVDGPLILNDDRLIVDAALAGAGLAFVMEAQVVTDIAAGRLVRVLDEWCPRFPGFYLYYPDRRLMRPALRAFVDFARAWRP